MKKTIFLALLVLFVFAAAAVYAEDTALSGLSLSAGAYRPTSSKTQDTLGETWLELNLGYSIPSSWAAGKYDTEIGVGYIKANGETFAVPAPGTGTFETKARIIPVTYTLRTRPAPGSKFYFGGGVGAYFIKLDRIDVNGNPSASTGSESSTKMGFKVLGGFALSPNASIELGYTGIGKTQGTKLSGLDLSIVGRF